jgi:hypothetical protein
MTPRHCWRVLGLVAACLALVAAPHLLAWAHLIPDAAGHALLALGAIAIPRGMSLPMPAGYRVAHRTAALPMPGATNPRDAVPLATRFSFAGLGADIVGALGVGGLAKLLGLGMIGPQVNAWTKDQLERIIEPKSNEGETISHVIFDSQQYISATTTELTFFQAPSADRTLTNFQGAGQLPDPQWAVIHNLGCDILVDATETAAATGVGDDIQKLMLVGRPVFTLEISEKKYAPGVPLSFLHTSGGAVGALATGTADTVQIFNNGITDGGWNWRGSVVIPPKVNINLTVNWSAAQTLAWGDPFIRIWFAVELVRRVL